MTTLALAILSVGTFYLIVTNNVKHGVIMIIPAVAAVACILSAFI